MVGVASSPLGAPADAAARAERLWLARLRWRMRGAWLWPAFFGLTAVDGALIQIWPGTYNEEPSAAQPDLPADNEDGTYSFEFHVNNPNAQNLIAIVGKRDITLRGMGDLFGQRQSGVPSAVWATIKPT